MGDPEKAEVVLDADPIADREPAARESIIYLDNDAPTADELRAEARELATILAQADFDSVAGIRDLGGYVARLSTLVKHLVDRSAPPS